MLVGEARSTIESLALTWICEPGDNTPAALVGVFVCEVFVEASVEEWFVSAGDATAPSLETWRVLL